MRFISILFLLMGCAVTFPIIEEEGLTVVQFDTDTVRRMCGPVAVNKHVYGCYFEQVKLLVCDEGDSRVCSEHACLIVKQLRGEDDLDACFIPIPRDLTIYIRNCGSIDNCLNAIERIP